MSLHAHGFIDVYQRLDADFVVKIIDMFPDTLSGEENGVPLGGYQMLVRAEYFAAGTATVWKNRSPSKRVNPPISGSIYPMSRFVFYPVTDS